MILLVPIVVLLAISAFDVARRPLLRRLAFRNANRRRGEALLVLIGSLLGTAIICASLIVGDSLRASIRDTARTQLGPVDEIVSVPNVAELPALVRALTPLPAGTDGGPLAVVRSGATVLTVGSSSAHRAVRHANVRARALELDFAAARRFGGDTGATGLAHAGATPSGDDAVLGKGLAQDLHVKAGDEIAVNAFGVTRTLRVRELVSQVGLAGFWTEDGSRSLDVFLPPGTIAAMAASPSANPSAGASVGASAAPPEGLALVSNDGGVYRGVDGTTGVSAALRTQVAAVPRASVITQKHDVLQDADRSGKSFTQLFTGMGAFSVIAGILLLVNIFVMLAEERKGELGMLRALGLRRSRLVRTFGIEGALYAVVASVLGGFAGVGLGHVIVWVARGIFASDNRRFGSLDLRFAAQPGSIVTGCVIGLAIALVTVWAASLRIGRLNVIRAIRDLPEPVRRRERHRTLALSAVGMVMGAALFSVGYASTSWFPALAGPALALLAAIPLASRVIGRRWAVTLACALTIAWASSAFSLVPRVFQNLGIPIFVVQGVLLVTTAVALVAHNDDLFVRVADRLSGSSRALAARLGLAYPLARRFRTSMTLGMYALVIFTLTFISVFSALFASQAPRFTADTRSGYDVVVDSNPGNPLTVALLARQPEVRAAAPLVTATPEFTSDAVTEKTHWTVTGFDASLLRDGNPKLSHRDVRFASDHAAWEAVLNDDSLAMVPSFFLQHGGGPPRSRIHPGSHIQLYDPSTGQPRQLTVAGVLDSDWLFNGAMVNTRVVRDVLGPQAIADRHYVAVQRGLDADVVAATLTARFLDHGADAASIRKVISDDLHQQEGFFHLIEGYLALGLVVGIAGLGVVMVRAVRERRRQVGMLRAMGFSGRVVRSAFLFEAAFVAVQGIVLGVALALLVSYQVLQNSKTFGGQQMGFVVPWASLGAVLGITLVASLVSTLAPATQAARIRPAVALRIAD